MEADQKENIIQSEISFTYPSIQDIWLFRELDQDFNCVKQWLDQAQAEQLTSNKLKSLKVAKWRKDDEGWIKNDEGWWFQAVGGFSD